MKHYDDLVFHPGGYVSRQIGFAPDPGEVAWRIDLRAAIDDIERAFTVEPWRLALRDYINEIRKEREHG